MQCNKTLVAEFFARILIAEFEEMGDIEDDVKKIMERARQRDIDLKKNSENLDESVAVPSPTKKAHEVTFEQRSTPLTAQTSNVPELSEQPLSPVSANRRSRLTELANNLEDFDYKPISQKPKEAFVKGPSPRLSLGETRPSVLFTPGQGRNPISLPKQSSPVKSISKSPQKSLARLTEEGDEQRHIRFALPVTASDERDSDSAHGTFSPREVTSFADQNEEDGEKQRREDNEEYGAHTFLKKKSTSGSANTSWQGAPSNSSSFILSPKPFSPSDQKPQHAPVRFNPSTSSPIISETRINISHTIPLDISMIKSVDSESHKSSTEEEEEVTEKGGSRDVLRELEYAVKAATASPSQITPSSARYFFAQLPSKSPVRYEQPTSPASPSPIRSAALSSAKASSIRKDLEAKLRSGEAQMPRPASLTQVPQGTPNGGSAGPGLVPPGVRTQWRGTSGTPVVPGSDPSQPTNADARAANLKNLRNRWEFSSATGTPLHPDKNEVELLEVAKKMAEQRETERVTPARRGEHQRSISSHHSHVTQASRESLTSSPVGKSPRLLCPPPPREVPEKGTEEDEEMIETESEGEEEEEEMEDAASLIIDQAFHFMDARSPGKQMTGIAPKATPERILEEAEKEERERERAELSERLRQQREKEERAEREWLEQEEKRKQEEAEEAAAASLRPAHPVFNAPPPPPASEGSTEDETASEGGSGSLVHTVSFYRKRRYDKADQAKSLEKIDFRTPSSDSSLAAVGVGQVIGGHSSRAEKSFDVQEEEARLQQSISVQQEQISQASRALSFCRQTQFRGSREEVDAQRALLVATETRRCLLKTVEDLRNGIRSASGPRGAMVISSISVPLSRDFAAGNLGFASGESFLYYFIILLKYGSHVHHTALLSSDDAARRKGVLEFGQFLRLEQLAPDFCCKIEVYSLRTGREQLAHEEKYKLKSGTLKKKSSMTSSSISHPQVIGDSSFQLVGRLSLDIHSVDRRKHSLQDAMHPLEGSMVLKIKRYAMEKGDVLHRGFLSLYQRTPPEGLGSWTRYWCGLQSGEMRFWRCPEDETTKEWLVLIDLSTSASNGVQAEAKELCPFPNSFHVDVWIPKDPSESSSSQGNKQMEKLRVLMAADSKAELNIWVDILNKTIHNLLLWSAPVSRAV